MILPPPSWADVDAWRATVWCALLGLACVFLAQLCVPQERSETVEVTNGE